MATPTNFPTPAVAGEILTAAYVNQMSGAFRVLQVVYGFTSSQVINSTNVYADTNLTATITPQSATNKVLVYFSQSGVGKEAGTAGSCANIQLLRGATNIGTYSENGTTNSSSVNYIGSVASAVLDSPATTSAVIYKTQFLNPANASNVRVQVANTSLSTMILMEISA